MCPCKYRRTKKGITINKQKRNPLWYRNEHVSIKQKELSEKYTYAKLHYEQNA